MTTERCISACHEKARLGIRHGLCASCADALTAQWRHLLTVTEALADDYEALLGGGVTWDTQPDVLRQARLALGDTR